MYLAYCFPLAFIANFTPLIEPLKTGKHLTFIFIANISNSTVLFPYPPHQISILQARSLTFPRKTPIVVLNLCTSLPVQTGMFLSHLLYTFSSTIMCLPMYYWDTNFKFRFLVRFPVPNFVYYHSTPPPRLVPLPTFRWKQEGPILRSLSFLTIQCTRQAGLLAFLSCRSPGRAGMSFRNTERPSQLNRPFLRADNRARSLLSTSSSLHHHQ